MYSKDSNGMINRITSKNDTRIEGYQGGHQEHHQGHHHGHHYRFLGLSWKNWLIIALIILIIFAYCNYEKEPKYQ